MTTRTLPLDYALTVYGGATFHREFRWLPDGSTALDFTDWSASMLIGQSLSKTPIVSLTSANDGVSLSTGGQIILSMSAVQTASLPPGVLTYSLDLTDPAGTVTRFLRGRLSVVTDVGRST
jgi:hypothetical protein